MKKFSVFLSSIAVLFLVFTYSLQLNEYRKPSKNWIYFASNCSLTGQNSIIEFLISNGITPEYYSPLLNAATAFITSDEKHILLQNSYILEINPVSKMRTLRAALNHQGADHQSIQDFYGYSLSTNSLLNTIPLHKAGITGRNIVVGVIDTGFEDNHTAFKNTNILHEYDFINNDSETADEFFEETGNEDHGTAILSVVAAYDPGKLIGTAYGASFVLAKTEIAVPDNPELLIEEENFIRGLDWLDSLNVDIITSSLAFQVMDNADYYSMKDMNGKTSAATRAADILAERGVLFFNGAGNGFGTDWDIITAPADGYNVIAVGAVDQNSELTDFSAAGPTADGRLKPEILAPGIVSVAYWQDHVRYVEYAGTSLASPAAAGVAALVLSAHPDLNVQQVREALFKSADRSDRPQNRYGHGLINAVKAATYFGPAFSNLPEIEHGNGCISISMLVLSKAGIKNRKVLIHYSFNNESGSKSVILENASEGNLYTVEIQVVPGAESISFYFTATDKKGRTSAFPGNAFGENFKYNISDKNLSKIPLRNCLRAISK